MNSKKQMGILLEANLGTQHTAKMELSVKNFDRFNNIKIITQVR